MTLLAIAAGGALGALARHGVNHLVHARLLTTRFPVATILINLIGCFAIGVLAGLVASERLALRLHWREFVFVGLLGGFTTFSTFGLDTLLLSRYSTPQAALNVTLQVAGGLLAVWAGYGIAARGPS
jgi:fluoride exporter